MVGEVGVVGLVHHLAAHALTTNTTTNNLLTLFSPLSNTNSLCPLLSQYITLFTLLCILPPPLDVKIVALSPFPAMWTISFQLCSLLQKEQTQVTRVNL